MPKLGKTQIETPSVIMGAWALGGWYWGGTDDSVGIQTIRRQTPKSAPLDTAPVYGCGHWKVLGQALKERRDKALIFTKVGLRWDSDEGAFLFCVRRRR